MREFAARRLVGALVLVAAAAGVAVAASPASAATSKTDIRVQETNYVPPELEVSGDLATSRRCRSDRRMKLVFIESNGKKTVGDRTSSARNGNWRLEGVQPPVLDARAVVRVSRKRLGKRASCGADKQEVPLIT